MKTYYIAKSWKTSFNKVITASNITAAALFVLSIFLLLLASGASAETQSGMINRAPLEKVVPKPSSLEKISSDLDDIIKSINEVPEEEKSVILIAAPKKPAKKPAPVIAKPKKVSPAPEKVKTAKKAPKKKPVVAKAKKPAPVKPKPIKVTQIKPVKPAIKTSYLKYSNDGSALTEDADNWSCTKDASSGLLWEVKVNNDGIRDKDHLYSWFDPSLQSGIADGGRCKGEINCDTNAYVQAMNQQKLCGYDDWRLPTREEMQSLIYFDKKDTDKRINSEYFPQAMASWYWTASSNKDNPGYAWYVLFKNGISLNDLKERPKHIRLVRRDNKA